VPRPWKLVKEGRSQSPEKERSEHFFTSAEKNKTKIKDSDLNDLQSPYQIVCLHINSAKVGIPKFQKRNLTSLGCPLPRQNISVIPVKVIQPSHNRT
jgi:hypothetical protein